ncbi:MAG TPA: peptidase [Caulobacteraceae bacterium]|nr:peptidase [Caulobacteraceae bacterium]
MTYCLGMLLASGLVLASDSRSNAGVDQVQKVSKLALITVPRSRVIAILSAGNLATTQSVVTELTQAAGLGRPGHDLHQARTMFDVAEMVGDKLREVTGRDGKYVEPYGDPSASFLVGGEIAGEGHRLFEVYSAGNFVEASPRSCFLQIGETKYGKPILDRGLAYGSPLEHAAKLALLSFDATVRSNLSVGLPIDLLRYEAGSLEAHNLITLEEQDAYWRTLSHDYSTGLTALVDSLPAPPDQTLANA